MAKKTDEAIKDLAKEVKKLRKENEKLGKSVDKARKDQAESRREILALLQERLADTGAGPDVGADVGADAAEYRGIQEEEALEDGAVVAVAELADEQAPEARADEQEDPQQEPEVTDAAKRRAEELGVDPASVEGTGSGGRVLVKDVEAAAER